MNHMDDINNHNVVHDAALTQAFKQAIGRRVFILTPAYPFMFIGKILDVVGDTVEVYTETTHFAQLEERSWFIHIHNIEVFYIEYPGKIEIPKLNDMS